MTHKPMLPAVIIVMGVLTSFGTIAVGHVVTNKPLVFLNYLNNFGMDYIEFFRASQKIMLGQPIYDVVNNQYVTTPIPALFNLIFVPLGFQRASIVLYGLITLALAGGYLLFTSAFDFSTEQKKVVLLTGLTCLLFGYPFYFLLQRENIDGWVFLFLCLGLYWLQKPDKEILSGFFFSLAIVFKLYPILIVVPIILNKNWRLLLWLVIWLILWGGLSLFWLTGFREAMAIRSGAFFRFNENSSLVATMSLILIFLNGVGVLNDSSMLVNYSPAFAALVYGILISLAMISDIKSQKQDKPEFVSYTLYLPFMIALPKVVYHYSLVICLILIPTLCYLWEIDNHRLKRITIIIVSIGISLTQWQTIATYQLTNDLVAHVIPGLGLLMIMVGITTYKLIEAGIFRPKPAMNREQV